MLQERAMSVNNATHRLGPAAVCGFIGLLALLPFSGCAEKSVQGRSMTTPSDDQTGPDLGVALRETDGTLTVANVQYGSPAAEAGLRVGDVLVSANANQVDSAAELKRELQAVGESGRLTLEVRREGQMKTLHADLGETETRTSMTAAKQHDPQHAAETSPVGGIHATAATTSNESRHQVGYRGEQIAADDRQTDADSSIAADSPPVAVEESRAGEEEVAEEVAAEQSAAPENAEEGRSTESNETDTTDTTEASTTATLVSTEARSETTVDANSEEESVTSETDAPETPAATLDKIDPAELDSEITAEEVENKLEEARNALEGFMRQKAKLDYREKMHGELQAFDRSFESLQREVSELEKRLAEKKQRMEEVRAKREAFISELKSLDPATTSPWEEKRSRIEAAWKELKSVRDSSKAGANEDNSTE